MNSIHKKLSTFILGAVLALGVGVGVSGVKAVGVKAEDDPVVYTLTPATGTNSNYAGNCDITIDKITWNVTGNLTLLPWRIGGKSLTKVDRAIYSKTAIASNVSKIDITFGAASSVTVNSLTVTVYSSLENLNKKSDAVSTVSGTFKANSTVSFVRPESVSSWEGMFYHINLNVTISSTSNKYVAFSGAKFYGTTPVKPSIEVDNAPSSNLEINASGTFTATTQNITEPVLTWSSSDTSVVEIDSATGAYTAKVGGATTITASVTGTELSEPLTASFEVVVNYGTLTIAEAIELGKTVESGATLSSTIIVTGYVTNLNADSQDSGKERMITLSDKKFGESDANTLNVFGVYSSNAFRTYAILNGQVTVEGNLNNYYSKLQLKNPSFSNYSDDAIEFGALFLSKTKDICADNGKVDHSEALEAVWSELETEFGKLDSYAQAKVKSTKADASGEDLENAVARYDHIVGRYSLKDFIGRVSTSGSNYQDRANSNNAFILVLISIISVMALAGTASLVVIKKRKSR